MVLLQAWPGLLSPARHWVLAATSAVLWPLLHAGLQRMPAPEQLPEAMPIVEMGGADDEPPLEFEGDLPAMLYDAARRGRVRSEEHTSELQSLMRISYAVFCLKKKKTTKTKMTT